MNYPRKASTVTNQGTQISGNTSRKVALRPIDRGRIKLNIALQSSAVEASAL